MNKQFLKFVAIVIALGLIQTLFSIAFAKSDLSALPVTASSDNFYDQDSATSQQTSVNQSVSAGEFAYVTLGYSHLVSVIDTTTHAEVMTIDVGSAGCYFPFMATMSPDGDFAYIGCSDSESIAVISTVNNTVLANISGIYGGSDIAFTQDGTNALATLQWNNQVAIVDTSTFTVTNYISTPGYARNIATHPFLNIVYVTSDDGTIQIMDATTFDIIDTIFINSPLGDIEVSSDGQWIFVAGWWDGLHVIDANTNTLFTTVTGLGEILEVVVAPDSSEVYLAGDYTFHVIDTQTFTPITSIPAYPTPLELETSCDGREVFMGNNSGHVPVFDTRIYSVTFQIPVSSYWARGIALCPQYVADGVYLNPPAQTNDGRPGDVVMHELTLLNVTGATDSYTLTLGSHSWDTSLSTSLLGPLDDGEAITFTVSVTVPVGTDWYLTDTVVLTATSVLSPNIYLDSAQLTTQAYAPPEINVLPDALSSTQFVNEIMSQTMTITNGFGVTLTFGMYESDNGFMPTIASTGGQGEWLYRNEQGIQIQNGEGIPQTVYPSSYRWKPDRPASSLNILVYADDWIHTAPDTFIDQALQALSLGYTAHYDFNWIGFENYLNNGNWDIVLVGADNINFPSSTFVALNNYVLGGGKLIIHSEVIPSWEPLWATVGFSYTVSAYPPPPPVEWWEPGSPVFNSPESVPELTSPFDIGYSPYAHYGNALSGFDTIAGYTSDPAENQAALIIGNEGRTVFKGFLDVQGGADLDGDLKPDSVELWINLINGIQTGFAGDVPWLSEEPITGTITTDSSLPVDIYFDSNDLQPGEYFADLLVQNNDPNSPLVTIPVTMTVQPTANMGWVEGYVTDISTGDPLEATIIAFGQPYTITTNPVTGYYKFWLDQGAYTLQVSASGYVSETAGVDITAQQGSVQDFELVLNVPVMQVEPNSLTANQLVGEVTTQVFTITNNGPAPLTFEIGEIGSSDPASQSAAGLLLVKNMQKTGLESSAIYTGPRTTDQNAFPIIALDADIVQSGSSVLIVQDSYPWGYDSIQQVLNNYGIVYDQVDSSMIPSVDLSLYELVIIPSVQDSSFYSIWNANLAKFEGYVEHGGALWLSATTFGDTPLLPGGVINTYEGEDNNEVMIPEHPWVAGVPNPIFGTSASHNWFTNLYPDSLVVAQAQLSGNATLVDYGIGLGRILLTGQTLEYAWANSQDGALILENSLLDMYLWESTSDVSWLSQTPISGTLSGYSSLPIQVTFDATGLQPGTHTAEIVIDGNDPLTPTVSLPVTIIVQPTANMGSVTGIVTDAWTGEPLTATVQMVGVYTTTATPNYSIWAVAGEYTLIASAPGYYTATWPVTINAGGQTILDLALEPFQARLDFAPFPLEATVPQGATAEYTLVISNTGPAPLHFDLHELSPTLQLAPVSPSNLDGKNILYDLAHGEDSNAYYSTLISATVSAGANVDLNNTYPIDASVLEGYDVLWVNGGYTEWSFGELSALLNWLEEGGAVLIQGGEYPSNIDVAGIYNIFYEYGGCTSSQTTNNIISHPVTANIDEIFIDYTCYFLNAAPETDIIVYDPPGQPHAVVHEENGGKMIVIADEIFLDWNIGSSDNLAFGLNALSWLASPAYSDIPWFATSPISGTVPGHDSLEVIVSFDASNLSVGEYEAALGLEHNDFALPTPIQIPVNLTVVDAEAGVSLTPTTLQATGLPGETVVYTITLTNEGNVPDTFSLDVNSAWEAILSAVTTPELDPGETYTFTLSVTVPADASEGDSDIATVTVESDFDPTVTASIQATTTGYLAVQKIFLPIVVR